jgi:nitrite reductase/ring-hydroxylating ferredoxin subunit/uncharacterized membrane protein
MRARASFESHPFHQMLIPFPLAFLLGAFGFDVAGVLLSRPALWTTGAHLALAGVGFALVAAVPGLVDLVWSVPPRSTGKSRGIKHAAANLASVGLFAAAWLLRGDAGAEPALPLLGAEALGGALLVAGSWMGGTLVVRNQIGIDHRYAGAGKWRERTVHVDTKETASVTVAAEGLEPDQMMLLHVGERRIVLGRTKDGFVAFDDRCPHRGGSLADGVLICGTVQCPWHGSQFDAATGKVQAGPAEQGIRAYKVEATGKDARITL